MPKSNENQTQRTKTWVEPLEKFDCTGIGLCTIDRIMLVPEFPGSNEKHTALRSRTCGGGPVANAVYALARLGNNTALCGKVGGDYEGRLVWEESASAGINTRYMISDAGGKTPCAQIWVDAKTGSRTVVLDDTLRQQIRYEDLPPELIQNSKYILLDGRDAELSLKIADLAHESDSKIVYDLGSMRKDGDVLLESADIVIASRDFAEAFNPDGELMDTARKIRDYRAKTAVVTLGEEGCVWMDNEGAGNCPAYKVDVVDTTGAGDVFHGAFIHGLLRGWDTRRCAEFASAAAGMTCTILGGRDAFDTEREVLDFMEVSS